MTIDFYYTPGSSPCRSILMAAKILGVELNLKVLNLSAGEHLTPEFLKINPQHCIPTLVDDGFALWESRAILVYLAEKYGKDDSLYPKCPKKKAVINQRLYFDALSLYASFADYFYPYIFAGAPLDEEKLKKLNTAFEYLETFLTGNKYVANDSLSLADLAVVASVTTVQAAGIDVSKYTNVAKWVASIEKEIPGYEETNKKGAEAFRQLVLNLTSKK